ncbi:MAG: hypothetical protein ABJB74_18060, partial [Gemmatimonas sp.]
ETLTGLVQLMSESGRLARVETGSSKFDALLGPILTAIPTLGAYIIAGLVLTNEPWYGRMIVPAIPTVVLGALVWIGKKRYWPRPLRDIAALKVYLP